MIELEAAQAHVLQGCSQLAPQPMALADAVGLVLAEDVVAGEDVPPFRNAAVDGYAVRAADVADAPVVLDVVDEVAAGSVSSRKVGPGQAIRIMTGAPMPDGADAAVMVEVTEAIDRSATSLGKVLVRQPVVAGSAVREVGDDIHSGTTLFRAGVVVRPAVAGVLASVNALTVVVVPRARVAVLSTGDELVGDGATLLPGQIRESNKTMLAGLVAGVGCDVDDLGIIRDDEAELEAVLRAAAATCDAVVTSGGVSMGEYDVVKAVLGRIADMRWMQVAIKPAKPLAFGLLTADDGRAVPVLGLPGNPVSSLVSFELFARPALRALMGHPAPHRRLVPAVADAGLARRPDGKVHVVRVTAEFGDDGRLHVRSVGAQGSHQLAASSLASGLAIVPDGDGVPPGGHVDAMLLWVA